MPTVPTNTKCRELGCPNQKTYRSTFCADHGGGITEKGKENSKLYSTAYWKKQRASQLSKNPLCASCLLDGKVVSAEHIDHVFPHRQDGVKFKNNIFQSLCASCHTNKTLEENIGVYLHYTSNGVIKYTDADYGYKIANQTELTQNI
jgi:5-methylcytosine-specific restriction protein A